MPNSFTCLGLLRSEMRRRCVTAALAVLSTGSVALANAARLPSLDGWVVARGHAATASVDSSAAAWFNPAGLTRLTADEIRVEPSFIDVHESFRPATGGEVKEQSDPFFTPSAFAAHRLNDRVVLGLGLVSPYGLASDWPTNSGFAGLATYSEIRYVTGVASAGWQLKPGLSVGAAVEYSSARAELNRLTPIAPTVVRSYGFRGRDQAFSGSVGIQWDIDERSSIGIHYQLPTTLKFHGTATLEGVTSAPGRASAWSFADNLAIGYRYRIAPDWEAEFDVDWTFWNRVDAIHLDAGPLSTNLVLNWQRSAYYSFGVEHRLNADWRVAAGYQYSQNSVPDLTFNPSLPDSSRHLLDAGIERTIGHWQIQAFVETALRSSRTIAAPRPDGLGGSAAGTYHNSVLMLGTSVAYRF